MTISTSITRKAVPYDSNVDLQYVEIAVIKLQSSVCKDILVAVVSVAELMVLSKTVGALFLSH